MKTQDEVRNLLIQEIDRGRKQSYIAESIGIPRQVLSAFKLNKKELYPESLAKLEEFLSELQ